jgi:hypothetical protein
VPAIGGGLTVTAMLGTADASGYSATIDRQSLIPAALTTATASGYPANIDLGATITASQAIAAASGYAATVDRHLGITASIASAAADGYPAALQVGSYLTINALQALAAASGYPAGINQQFIITASPGEAVASGFSASLGNGLVGPSATGSGGGGVGSSARTHKSKKLNELINKLFAPAADVQALVKKAVPLTADSEQVAATIVKLETALELIEQTKRTTLRKEIKQSVDRLEARLRELEDEESAVIALLLN